MPKNYIHRPAITTQFQKWITAGHRLFWLILILAFALRLYKVDSEPLDWHAFRQADTASVSREYAKHGVDLLVPRYQDLSNIQSGKDNLEGYRMVEFPLVNALVAWIVQLTGAPLIVTSRLVSIFFSLGTIVSLYLLVKKVSGQRVGLFTALLYAVLPYSVFYSRAILPEPAMLFFSTISFVWFLWWLESRKVAWYFLSLFTLTVALLLKPSIAFLFPVYGGLIIFHELNTPKQPLWNVQLLLSKTWYYVWRIVPALGVAMGTLYLWRHWIEQFPSGIPALDWLFNGNGIRFRPAWFRWLFWERLTKLISGYLGIGLLICNLRSMKKDLIVYGSWALGIFVYLVVIATGNVQHDYYQIIALPIVAIGMGRGCDWLLNWLTPKCTFQAALTTVLGVIISLCWFSWSFVQGYYNINHYEYMEAGRAVDRLTPPDALVIAPAFGDTQFLFQTNRRGWPIGFEIEDKIAKGAQYYVTTSDDDEARRLQTEYRVIEKTDRYLLIDLQQPAESRGQDSQPE